MTMYIDIVIIENLIMNYIILYATGIVTKVKMKKIRVLISSLIGAIFVAIQYVTNLKIYSNIIVKTILSILMIFIAFNPQKIKQLGKQLILFYLTTFTFGGVATYLIYVIKPQDIIIKNGMFAGQYVFKVIFLGAILAVIVIKFSIKIIKTKINTKDMYCNIEIKLDSKIIKTKAMIDTGNLAKEPITNTPVVIVESSLLESYLPKELLRNIDNVLAGDLKNVPENYISKLRCIPFSSLGKQNGLLLGMKAEEITIIIDDEKKIKQNVIIGIYEKSLTKRGEYRALIGIDEI